MSERPLPTVDRDSAPWWEALAAHRLILQRCTRCNAWRWPARAICNRCGSFEWSWQPASGQGSVASWIVTHHSFNPVFVAPYVTVLVRLDEDNDILIPGGWDGQAPVEGQAVVAGFQDVADGVTLLQWASLEP
jgi:uncharacterized OB-fold protein